MPGDCNREQPRNFRVVLSRLCGRSHCTTAQRPLYTRVNMKTYSIGQFANKVGLTPRALRFYESKGLLTAQRTEGNRYRYYTERDVEPATQICFFKNLGFSLEEIQALLRMLKRSDVRTQLEEAFAQQLVQHRKSVAEIQRKTQTLEKLLTLLNRLDDVSFQHLQHEQTLHQKERQDMFQTLQNQHAQLTTIGARSHNDDHQRIKHFDQGKLYIIADGSGADGAGERASQTAADAIANHLDAAHLTPSAYQQHFGALIARANRAVYALEQGDSNAQRPLTTLTFLVLYKGRAYIGHVGDSRVYRFVQGQLSTLTKDHTRVQQLLDAGEILCRDIPGHELQHILCAAVGHSPTQPDAFFHSETIAPDSLYLLTTDGITNVLADADMVRILQTSPTLQGAVKRMVELAQIHGEDNASAMGVIPQTTTQP